MSRNELYWKCLRIMLRPVARFALRHSIQLQSFFECTKVVFLEVAKDELERAGAKRTNAGIAAMTGLHRKDVARLIEGDEDRREERGVLIRIINQWQADSRFTTARNRPRVLSYGRKDSEFTRLVESVSVDLRPKVMVPVEVTCLSKP